MAEAAIFAHPEITLDARIEPEQQVMVSFSCGRREVSDNPNDSVNLTVQPARRDLGPVFGPFEYAELTYDTLRYGPNGDTLAFWDADEGDWRLTGDAGQYVGETYSDITIFPARICSLPIARMFR